MAVSQKEDNSRAGVKVSETDKQLTIENDGITYYFDKATGYLQQVEKNGKTVSLSGGPAVAGLEHTLKSLKYFEEGDTLVVQPEYEGKPYYKVRWEFVPGQPVKLAYAYNVPGEVPYMGITFNYPEEKITGVKWLGRGPYRVWKNRLKGPQFGIWEKKYSNTVTGESWDYPEFKGYHSELHWVRVENKEMPFTVYAGLPGLFLQMLKPDKPKAAGNDFTNPPFPEGSIGFLHAISPIGTKFKAPEQMGPQGYKNIILNYSPIKGVLWFDFR